jgi:hypothetical protein
MEKEPTKCENIFCLHHATNVEKMASWNKTDCSFYEVDPFDKKNNPNGIKVEDCEVRKKYKRYGW